MGRQRRQARQPTWVSAAFAGPGYPLSTTARRHHRPLSFARLPRRLQFLPLGLFWGLVAGGLHSYQLLWLGESHPRYHGIDLWAFVVPLIIGAAVICPISTLLCSARLKRELTSTHWTLNWVITASASGAAGIAIFWPIIFIWGFLWMALPTGTLGYALLAMLFLSTGLGILIGIELAVVALVLAPLSLLARRLILRRRPVAEPAGGASQPQP